MVKFKVKASQKENWRYIGFELICSRTNFSEQELARAITSAVTRLFGETGASKTNLWLLEYSPANRQGIVRCSHTAQRDVLAALTAVIKVDEMPAVLNVFGVSGTIKKLREKFLK